MKRPAYYSSLMVYSVIIMDKVISLKSSFHISTK